MKIWNSGCFALCYRSRQVQGIAFDYHLLADPVTDTIQPMAFEAPGSIWHTSSCVVSHCMLSSTTLSLNSAV
jgi:hypothetical protein